jgi:ABC-type Na+ efflux pump permease subunit
MPANKKYLTSSPTQRFAKITAAILGGLIVAVLFHMALASWFNHVAVIITSTFSAFILWAVLMVLAFLGKNGWKIWGIYLAASLLFGVLIYFGQQTHPIV